MYGLSCTLLEQLEFQRGLIILKGLLNIRLSRLHFIVALNEWHTLYPHLRLTLGRDPFKVIRPQSKELKHNRTFQSSYSIPRHVQDRSCTVKTGLMLFT